MKRSVGFILTMLVISWAFTASAQDNQADNMKLVVEKIRADKRLFIAKNMQLTSDEEKTFWPIYDKYQEELFLLRARTKNMINDYAKAYKKKMTNDIAKSLINEYMTIERLGLKLRKRYLSKFRKVLSDVKVMRYYQIENKIEAAQYYELAKKIPLVKER